jgi:hypothetical protein
LGFQGLPQNSLNQRPTTSLFRASFDITVLLSMRARPCHVEYVAHGVASNDPISGFLADRLIVI